MDLAEVVQCKDGLDIAFLPLGKGSLATCENVCRKITSQAAHRRTR